MSTFYLLQSARQGLLVGVGPLLGEAGTLLHRRRLLLPELRGRQQPPALSLQVPDLLAGHLYTATFIKQGF